MDKYILRDDKSVALKVWQHSHSPLSLNAAYDKFFASLQDSITRYTSIDCFIVDSDWQKSYLASLMKTNNLINLDFVTFLPGQYYYGVSRVFELNSAQSQPLRFIKRQESFSTATPNPAENLILNSNHIPPGDYIYVDDDIASGSTLSFTTSLLQKSNIEITSSVNLAQAFCQSINAQINIYDILDVRDFLIGSFMGGLVCDVNTVATRVPYLWPWVNLNSRAKIKPENIKEFNRSIILANLEFFKSCPISWSEVNPYTAAFLLAQIPGDNLYHWCENYLKAYY